MSGNDQKNVPPQSAEGDVTPKPEKDTTLTESAEGDKKLYDIVTSIQAAMMRVGEPNLPIWSSEWTDSDNQMSFKAHTRAFENYARMLQWDSNMKALKFQMTLRGKIRQHIDTLNEETSTNYDLLKKELMAVYHETKDPHTKIHEWNAIVWRPKSMKLQRLGALLLTGYKAFVKNGEATSCGELMLKDRFLKAIREGHPKFAQFIELNRPQNQSYKDLVTYCANKFQVYKHEVDIEDEDDVVALVAADGGRRQRQEYYPRERPLEQRYNRYSNQEYSEPRQSEYDRRRDEWRRQNAWKYERYNDNYRYDQNRYGSYGDQSRGQQQRESYSPQNYTPRRPAMQQTREGYNRRMISNGQEPRRFNGQRDWRENRRQNWNNDDRRRYYDNKQQGQQKRNQEDGKKGTTVPENRQVTFLEEKAKN